MNERSIGSEKTRDEGTEEIRSLGDLLTRRQRKRFKTGDKLLGRYCILGELGQGGMGLVFRCMDEIGGIEVAVKMLPPEVSHDSGEMDEVRENFRLVSSLAHPNIATVRTLEKDSATGEYLLVMELAQGMNLRAWRKGGVSGSVVGGGVDPAKGRDAAARRPGSDRGGSGGPALPLGQILPVIRQIASALDHAHENKVVHRDIKPSNVMVDAQGRVKVLDFGLAAQIHTSFSRVSQVRYGTSGTGPYMAPEQWRGEYQDGATDQYALAVLAYELLAGHCPFESHETTVLKQAVLDHEPKRSTGLPDAAWAALKRGLAKKREERYESCADFVAALGGERIQQRTTRKGSGWKWVAALAVLAGLGATGVWMSKLEMFRHAEKGQELTARQEGGVKPENTVSENDLSNAKIDAEIAWEQLQKIDGFALEGYSERKLAVERQWRRGQDNRDRDKIMAIDAYQTVVTLTAALNKEVEDAAQESAFKQAKTNYETALRKEDVSSLRQYGGTAWQQVTNQVNLGEEYATNPVEGAKAYAEALKLVPSAVQTAKEGKQNAESHLPPILTILTTADGMHVKGTVSMGKTNLPAPATFLLEKNKAYTFTVSYPSDPSQKRWEATEFQYTPALAGSQTQTVALKEIHGPVAKQDWTSPTTGMDFVWVESLGIWVAKYEVMNGEYEKCDSSHASGKFHGYSLDGYRQPVVQINFEDVTKYADWMTKQDAKFLDRARYRLPSESEWMAFAQCGDERKYPWGNYWPPSSGWAGNYDDETDIDPARVEGGYADGHVVSCNVEDSWKNDWGLFGVGGNVWEITTKDGDSASFGAYYGASWSRTLSESLSCSNPSDIDGSNRYDDYGFRLVLSP